MQKSASSLVLGLVGLGLVLLPWAFHAGEADSAAGGPEASAAPDVPRPPEGMVHVAAGVYAMGLPGAEDETGPAHEVELGPFFIDRHEVTNRQFAAFVEATGHVTQAETDGYAWCFVRGAQDFAALDGADWRHPEGAGSSIADRMDHPVVCVSWDDAGAYATWAGKRLPTEAEWEYVARAGRAGHSQARVAAPAGRGESSMESPKAHPIGGRGETTRKEDAGSTPSGPPPSLSMPGKGTDRCCALPGGPEGVDVTVRGVPANYWQGTWPSANHEHDGFYYTAPAGRFPANDWGVHDMIGNVWEWCADRYGEDFYARSPRRDPRGPDAGPHRVARGGSWFCSENHCGAYSSWFRGHSPADHAFNNVGFRCAADLPSTAGPRAAHLPEAGATGAEER